MSATLQLAKFIAATPPEEIPDDVLHHGKRCMINMLAVALHATQNPALGIFLDLFEDEGGRKQASVLGVGVKTTVQNAAMANGFLAHLDDFDDTFLPTVFHPSAPAIPPALALAEYEQRSGRDFLTACVLGLEVSCRIALAVQSVGHGGVWHMTGTVGVFGAAASAGRLLKLDADAIARALGLAGTQASGLRETFGTMTKAFHPARAAQSGLLAAMLVRGGFTCTPSILEGRHGFAAALSPDAADLGHATASLGKHWEFMNTALKPYACGILAHAMVDAMRAMRVRTGVGPERVASVSGRVNPLAIRLESRPHPNTGLEGRLSFQHAIAMAFIDGTAYPAQFTDERVSNPVAASLRSKINVAGDESMPQDACELTLTLTDGGSYTERVSHATGTIDNPMTDAQLNEKFQTLVGGVLSRIRAEELLEVLWQLERLDNMGKLVSLCRI